MNRWMAKKEMELEMNSLEGIETAANNQQNTVVHVCFHVEHSYLNTQEFFFAVSQMKAVRLNWLSCEYYAH